MLLPQHLTVCVFGTTVDHKFLWLCFALALWGLGQGAGPVVEALLADSTRTGQLQRQDPTTSSCSCDQTSLGHFPVLVLGAANHDSTGLVPLCSLLSASMGGSLYSSPCPEQYL